MRFVFIASLISFQSLAWALPLDQSNIDIKGLGRARGEVTNNKDFSNASEDKNNFVGSRFRLSINVKPNDKTNIFTEFQYSKTWGLPSATLQNDPSSIFQAYIQHSLFENLQIKIGRQTLAYGDELLIGAVGWSNIGRSFDAFKTRFTYDWGWTDLFVADVSRTENGVATNDHYFSGLYNHFSFDQIDELELYFLNTQDPSATINRVSHYGLRIKSKNDSLDYRVEVTGQSEVDAHQWDAEAGYALGLSRLSLEFFSASKDFIQLFPTAHKWLGIGDFITRRNISGLRTGLNHKFSDKIKSSLNYHIFQRTDNSSPYYSFGGSAVTTTGTEKHIGDEIDLGLNYQVDETFSIAIGGAHFFAGKHLEENGLDSDGDFYYLQTKAVF